MARASHGATVTLKRCPKGFFYGDWHSFLRTSGFIIWENNQSIAWKVMILFYTRVSSQSKMIGYSFRQMSLYFLLYDNLTYNDNSVDLTSREFFNFCINLSIDSLVIAHKTDDFYHWYTGEKSTYWNNFESYEYFDYAIKIHEILNDYMWRDCHFIYRSSFSGNCLA